MLVFIVIELYIVAAVTLLFVLVKVWRARQTLRFRPQKPQITDDRLPSVSVCLPARNETNAMTECLESVLASDYPKLEVIVLDDGSTDNTSHLIRAFAHAGVRFIPGDPLPDDWLGKNYSLETLLDEASGHYVLFMDVDTRLSPTTIRSMVELMARKHATMLSIIPQRFDTYRASAWLSTLRYFWEIVLNTKRQPGSSSAAWMVSRQTLADELGGFGVWRDEVQPEMHIAEEVAKTDEYQLVFSTPALGVRYEKKWSSQIETSRRLLLPRFGNSIVSVLVGVGLLCLVILPQVMLLFAVLTGWWALFWAELALGLLAMTIYALYCRLAWRTRWWIGFFVAPYVAWQEIYVLLASAIGYTRGTITWKGRPVGRPLRKSHKK